MAIPEQLHGLSPEVWGYLSPQARLGYLRAVLPKKLADRARDGDPSRNEDPVSTYGLGLLIGVRNRDGSTVPGRLRAGGLDVSRLALSISGLMEEELGDPSRILPILVVEAVGLEEAGKTTRILATEINQGQVEPLTIGEGEAYPVPSSITPWELNLSPDILVRPSLLGEMTFFDASVEGILGRAEASVNWRHNKALEDIDRAFVVAEKRFVALEMRIGRAAQEILTASEARLPKA